MALKATIIPVTPYQQNCSVLWCDETMKGAVVDPGGDLDTIMGEAENNGVTIEKIFITHGHLDHAGGTADLKDRLGVPIEGPHIDDTYWIDRLPQDCADSGFPESRAFVPERWLVNEDQVTVGNLTLDVYHCPGHTPGHVVFHEPEADVAFVGDVLFQGSIGRTDFPRGNHEDLLNAIRTRLWPLGNDVTFVPGHGPTSTFGHERATNPYVGDQI
ncbi:MAG: MBL fold metallo-hydrolase [Rhodospirillales bacterium]|jgi:hydroxyacylglutathione hydrolase|nr:MBL fold metallo-hydrolase [Rhodospirillales bacterium]MBT4041367.1 MBL fold metallo-hydrolase [Rhodospirillales bacterium]MBT4626291.1 MBL fold metallo-hydrolase [Rhodospirillales bacterium]MBT5353042.1 MBL fold metallo-hydrolase [Rhodospirillales bacterium]MBT5520519.1 MBL fold metallo-hydrolase [Rhodospirillales bacterium]